MKNIYSSAALVLTLMSFTGCLEVEGKFTTVRPIVLKASVSENQDSRSEIDVDVQDAKLSVEEDQIVLQIGLSFFNSEAFVFKTGEQLNNIKSGDQFFVSSKTSGQPYDVQGAYTETLTKSAPFTEVESCNDDSKVNYSKCRNFENTLACKGPVGKRKSVYRDETVVQKIKASLIDKSKRVVGTFVGSKSDTAKNLISFSDCVVGK
jgi:hypothetical protein